MSEKQPKPDASQTPVERRPEDAREIKDLTPDDAKSVKGGAAIVFPAGDGSTKD